MRTRQWRGLATLALCSAFASACGRSEGDLLTPMCGAPSEGAPLPCATTWPNESSQANSDPWLVSHHDGLVSIHPRVLLLHFYNPMTLSEVSTNTDLFIAALAKGSSYQGYAPPFLHYEIAKLVDLSDASPPAGYRFPYSTQFPTMPDGSLDVGALFKDKFANLYQIADPQDPSHNLDLCQLFVRGLVNEVWLHVGEPAPPATTSILERRQIYDDSNHPIPGSFLTTAGTPAQSRALDMVGCPVTVRMVVIVPVTTPRPESQPIGRHVACSLMAHGFGMEAASLSVPYLTVHARPFLNLDFRSRFHVPFDGWRDVCTTNFSPCVFYSKEPTTQVWTARAATGAAIGGWNMRPFRQGCGTVDFPPNARFRWDFDNQVADQSVEARCDGYALGNGPDGGDRYDPYAPDTTGGLEGPFNCAPAWQMHWRESIPSYRNAAFDIEGRPMKNWWTFLFY